ncbi:unnamed protein product [Urochloa humidicola]
MCASAQPRETDREGDEGSRPEISHAAVELEQQPPPELRPSSYPSRSSSSSSTSRRSRRSDHRPPISNKILVLARFEADEARFDAGGARFGGGGVAPVRVPCCRGNARAEEDLRSSIQAACQCSARWAVAVRRSSLVARARSPNSASTPHPPRSPSG